VSPGVVAGAGVDFSTRQDAFQTAQGQLLRGTGNEFTLYSRGKTTCMIGGANYNFWSLGVASATVDPVTGNWKDQKAIAITIADDGTLPTACKIYPGTAEKEGGWEAWTTPLSAKVPASMLKYMCVDGAQAFVPTETWVRTDGTTCECTLQYTVACATRDR
jgi:hypothetical protein